MKRRDFIESASLAFIGMPILLSCTEELATNSFKKLVKENEAKTVAITAPGGGVFHMNLVEKTKSFLEGEGFKVILGQTLFSTTGYFSLNDQERAHELNTFFADEQIDIIMCARGGWGCNRIIPYLNLDTIRKNPKIFMGFSDITTLINLFYDKCGFTTYHGNMAYSSWGNYSYASFKEAISQQQQQIKNHSADRINFISEGEAEGILCGGNLTVLCSMIGTEYEPNWNYRILCIEETHEEPYRIDRMLNQLKDAGVFRKIQGVILGQFNKCEPEEPEKSFSLEDVFDHYFTDFGKPVLANASFGHVANKFVIPIGRKVKITHTLNAIELI